MKILITGADGQLGYDLQIALKNRGYEIFPTDADTMDITDVDMIKAVLSSIRPDVIIHAAAWTAVDAAEDNKDICLKINADGTENIAIAASSIGAKLIYISTDYVFDGYGIAPWKPEDPVTAPLNIYGLSKYKGELSIKEHVNKFFIVRISWVFGSHGKNFIKTMLRVGKERKEIKVVDDQIGSPTYTKDLSDLLADMVESEKYGIYHATNEGYCSWYEFAKKIFAAAISKGHHEYDDVNVIPVSSAEYPTKAKRPFNSRMDKSKLEQNGFKRLPSWENALDRFLEEIEY